MLWEVAAIIIPLLYSELIILFLYLLIKTLIKKRIEISFTKKMVGRFLASNILICSLIIGISYGYNSYNSVGENEIRFSSQVDLKEATELFDKNDLNYKVLIGKKIRLQNTEHLKSAIGLIQDTPISFDL